MRMPGYWSSSVASDGVHQVSFSHAHAAIDEQRIVAARRAVGHRPRRRVRKLIAGADHEIVETEFRIELPDGGSEDRFRRDVLFGRADDWRRPGT